MHDEVREAMWETLMHAGAALQNHVGHFKPPGAEARQPHAVTSLITFPFTSVRRMSRPAWR
jgi:hypothetical protein